MGAETTRRSKRWFATLTNSRNDPIREANEGIPINKTRWAASALALCLLFGACDNSDVPQDNGGVTEDGSATTPGIRQARWKLKAKMAPGHPRLTKKQRKKARAQVGAIEKVIEETYFALFLEPNGRKKVIGRRFAGKTASAFLKSKAGVPAGASEVRTTLRKGKIGIDPLGARLAAAKIAVKARGKTDDGRFRITHRAHLWLERKSGRWKVIAFDIDQVPS